MAALTEERKSEILADITATGLDLNALANAVKDGKDNLDEVYLNETLRVFKWHVESGRTEADAQEYFSVVCSTLKDKVPGFLPFNSNLPWFAEGLITWMDASEQPSFTWSEVKTVLTAVRRYGAKGLQMPSKMANGKPVPKGKGREPFNEILKSGASADVIKAKIEEITPKAAPKANTIWQNLAQAANLPAADAFLADNDPEDLFEVDTKVQPKLDAGLLTMVNILKAKGYSIKDDKGNTL